MPATRRTAAAFLALVEQHDLARFMLTRRIRIQHGALPHSHPVLTLGTDDFDAPDILLADFLHEQAHWLVSLQYPLWRRVLPVLEKRFPDAPQSPPDGAQDRHSTYLHLPINWLEWRALTNLLGRRRATKVALSRRHYQWIYRTVIEDDRYLQALAKRQRLILAPFL